MATILRYIDLLALGVLTLELLFFVVVGALVNYKFIREQIDKIVNKHF